MNASDNLRERLYRHVDVLSELIGERNSDHPRGIEAAREYLRRELRDMGHAVVEQTFPTMRRLVPVIELSDHRGYWDEGYPALMITNTAFLRNPNYHQPTDRLETLDFERMTALCRTLTRCLVRIAGS